MGHALRWLQYDDPALFQTLSNHEAIVQVGNVYLNEQDPDDLTVVDASNVVAYVERRAWENTARRIESQLINIALGFYDVVPYPTLSFFTVQEIVSQFRGPIEVDVQLLRQSTTYVSTVPELDLNRTVEWIWEAIESFNGTEMSGFLDFVSGSPYPPRHGFNRDDTWLQIHIDFSSSPANALPTSQTCFKILRLGQYDSPDILRRQLLFAITHTKTITLQ